MRVFRRWVTRYDIGDSAVTGEGGSGDREGGLSTGYSRVQRNYL